MPWSDLNRHSVKSDVETKSSGHCGEWCPGDRRLSGINNVGLTAGQFSTFAFTTTPENFVSGITETSDSTRRKFFDLARLNKAPIAIEAVARIDALFAIEREINGLHAAGAPARAPGA